MPGAGECCLPQNACRGTADKPQNHIHRTTEMPEPQPWIEWIQSFVLIYHKWLSAEKASRSAAADLRLSCNSYGDTTLSRGAYHIEMAFEELGK